MLSWLRARPRNKKNPKSDPFFVFFFFGFPSYTTECSRVEHDRYRCFPELSPSFHRLLLFARFCESQMPPPRHVESFACAGPVCTLTAAAAMACLLMSVMLVVAPSGAFAQQRARIAAARSEPMTRTALRPRVGDNTTAERVVGRGGNSAGDLNIADRNGMRSANGGSDSSSELVPTLRDDDDFAADAAVADDDVGGKHDCMHGSWRHIF